MKKIFLIFLLSLACFATSYADLYEATIPVAAQDNTTRDAAMQQALQSTLIKLSENSQVLAVPAIASALQNPALYVDSYTFQANPDTSNPALPYVLDVTFQPQAVEQLLKNAKQNVWTTVRPTSLIWVAVQMPDGSTHLISADGNDPLLSNFQTVATARAMPIIFPSLDLTDLNQVSTIDVSNNNLPTIQTASGRYDHGALIVAQLKQGNDGVWSGQWELSLNGSAQQWKLTAKTGSDLITNGLNTVFDALAQQYLTANPALQTTIMMTVLQINSAQDYANLMNYLQQINIVKQINVQQIKPDQVQLELMIDGSDSDLQNMLNLDNHLSVTNPSSASSGQFLETWQA